MRQGQLGAGKNGAVFDLDSSAYPGCVLKTGAQGRLTEEATMMAGLCHPGIVQPFAILRDPGSAPDPQASGGLIMEKMGGTIREHIDEW